LEVSRHRHGAPAPITSLPLQRIGNVAFALSAIGPKAAPIVEGIAKDNTRLRTAFLEARLFGGQLISQGGRSNGRAAAAG
jgi:hypothetical protein